MFIQALDVSKDPSKCSGVLRRSSVVLVDMVVVEHGGGGIKTTWVGRVVGDGGVGVRGRVSAADS